MIDFSAGLVPLEGGFSGETFVTGGGDERVVVRIYGGRSASRGPLAVDIDAAVLRLVRGLLPVPEVLEVRRPDASGELPGLLVTSLLPGERLDLVLPTASADLQERLGASVGAALARLSGIPFLRAGLFVDADLAVGDLGVTDLREWVTRHDLGWPPPDQAALEDLADWGDDLLVGIPRTCLVHSDFNPKNLLVDPGSGELTGVLDWEFAHAGLPVADLGNLLRFEPPGPFTEAAIATFRSLAPSLPDDLVECAQAADLWALVDLAARRGQHEVADRAHDRLFELARARTRVQP